MRGLAGDIYILINCSIIKAFYLLGLHIYTLMYNFSCDPQNCSMIFISIMRMFHDGHYYVYSNVLFLEGIKIN
jgi:hypothetical protein